MSDPKTSRTVDVEQIEARFEDYPLSRAEYISAMVHLYRGEQHRAQVWRSRLDTTTNWAVLSCGAFLSFAFGKDEFHIILILGMYIVFGMLVLESRRFRFYDVWRNRVRKFEENFYVPILRRDLSSPMENWGFYVASDLLATRYKITFLMALKTRLLANYLPLFLVLLGGWIVKLTATTRDALEADVDRVGSAMSFGDIYERALALGGLPPWLPLSGVVGFYAFLLWVLLFVKRGHRPEEVYFGTTGVEGIDDIG